MIFSRMTLRPFGPEGGFDGFGELVDACLEQVAGFLSELQFLGHDGPPDDNGVSIVRGSIEW